jgi:flagellin-like protein
MPKLQLNRRALSPIFATLLLLAIVMSVGSMAFYFSNNLAKNATDQYVDSISNSQQSVSERISFEHVTYASSTNTLTIYILNCGKANNVKINSLIILDINQKIVGVYSGTAISQLNSINGGAPTTDNLLNVGDEAYFTVTLTGVSLLSFSTYTIHLVTQSGSAFDYEFVP